MIFKIKIYKMKRSEIKLPEYFDRYINMADDVELMEALQISLHELENAPIKDWETIGNAVYSAGKWTIRHFAAYHRYRKGIFLQGIIICKR